MVIQNKTAGNYAIHDMDLVLKKNQVVNLDTQATAGGQKKSRDLRYAIEKGHIVVLKGSREYTQAAIVSAPSRPLEPIASIHKAVLIEDTEVSEYASFVMKDKQRQMEIVETTSNLKLLGHIVNKTLDSAVKDKAWERLQRSEVKYNVRV